SGSSRPPYIPTLRPKSGRATTYRDRRACQRRSAPRPLCQTGDIVSMSDVTYRRPDEPDRQGIGLASRRDQDTAIFIASEAGGGLSAPPAPERGIPRHAALATNAIVILEVFSKKTRATPKTVIDACRQRLKEYDRA